MTVHGHFSYVTHGPTDVHPGESFHVDCGGHIIFKGPEYNPTVHYYCERCDRSTTMTGVSTDMFWSPGESKVIDGKTFTYDGDGQFTVEREKGIPVSRVDFARDAIEKIGELKARRDQLIEQVSTWDGTREMFEQYKEEEGWEADKAAVEACHWYVRQYEKAKSIVNDGDVLSES